jgi:dihydroorotase
MMGRASLERKGSRMARVFDLILRGATCVTDQKIGEADIGVAGGKVSQIGDLSQADGEKVIVARGLHVLPGVIDTQVHFREPGLEHKEDLASGSLAAVMGGVTAVCEMPNTNPPTVNPKRFNDKLGRARGRMWCDFGFYIGATPENVRELPELERLPGCPGIKIFMGASTGTLLVPDDETLLKVLKSGKRRVAVHAEDQKRLNAREGKRVEGDVASHAVWRDVKTALLATERIVKLAKRAKRPVHVLHVTTREEIEFLAQHKDIASVEVTPQHLTLHAPECYERLGTYAQMNPPIREIDHQDGLWNGLLGGVVDVIGSDHAPHTIEEKEKPYPGSPSGMPGVQTLLPLMLNHVAEGRLDLHRLVQLTSTNAHRLFGIKNKGALAIGCDADFTVVDLKAVWRIDKSWLKSKCKWSPFDGMEIHGKPVATIIRGRAVMRDGDILGEARGRPLAFSTR